MGMTLLRKLTIGALLLATGGLLVAGGIYVNPAQAQNSNGAWQTPMDVFSSPAPAAADPKETFSTLLKAINYAGLNGTMKGQGPLTVFAPDDRAFGKLPSAQLTALISDKAKLVTFLKNLVITGHAYTVSDLLKIKSAKSAEGGLLTFATSNAMMSGTMLSGNRGTSASGGQVYTVNGAAINWADLKVANGIVQGIDTVIMPKM